MTKVRCGSCWWRGARKIEPVTAKPCPRCGGQVIEYAVSGAYLLHFDRPFGHAKHYLGYSNNIYWRVEHHRTGNDANLMRHVSNAGIGFVIARIWPGADRNRERRLHKRGGASRLCPICKSPGQRPDLTGVIDLHTTVTATKGDQ